MGATTSDLGSPYEETNSFASTEQDQIEKKHLQDQIDVIRDNQNSLEKRLNIFRKLLEDKNGK